MILNMNIKRLIKSVIFSLLLLVILPTLTKGQYVTDVIITGAYDFDFGTKISANLGDLCTEFNSAQYENRMLDFSDIAITEQAKEYLGDLWGNCHFRVSETEIIQPLLRTDSYWQVRNIPIVMCPYEEAKYDDELYQELVINMSPQGDIVDIHFAISSHLYSKVIKSNQEETDLNRRLQIVDFVERFRTAYNKKDIKFISDVFSDDALIIVGREIKRVAADNNSLNLNTPRFEQVVKTKSEYIKSLSRVFATNRTVKVDFSDIKIVKHPEKTNYYGVTLKQGWSADRYGDMGYVFLLVDFRNQAEPIIHVRTWQPEKYKNGELLSSVDIFSISDFECD